MLINSSTQLPNTGVRASLKLQVGGDQNPKTSDTSSSSANSDQVTLSQASESDSKAGVLASNAGFLGALAGTGIGIALAATSGASGGAYFVNSVLGAFGGGIVGRLTLGDPQGQAPLPGPLAGIKDNARNIGAVSGLGIGLGLALTSGNISGGAIFTNSVLGAIGGSIAGTVASNQ